MYIYMTNKLKYIHIYRDTYVFVYKSVYMCVYLDLTEPKRTCLHTYKQITTTKEIENISIQTQKFSYVYIDI